MTLQATLLAGAIAIIPALARADDAQKNQPSSMDHSAMDHGSKKLTDNQVLMRLHHINKEEIEVGQIAQKNGSTSDAKDYGATLVRDHTKADKDVTALASKMSVDLEAKKTDAMHQQKQQVMQNKMDQLKKLSGKDFDRAFAQMMVNGHRQAIEMVKDARGTVQSPELKSLLEQLLPTLQKHEDTANDVLNKAGNTASAR